MPRCGVAFHMVAYRPPAVKLHRILTRVNIWSDTVPLGNYSFDTIKALQDSVREYTIDTELLSQGKALAAAKGSQCELDIPEPHQVEIYPAQVAFEYIESEARRRRLPDT